MIVNEAIFIKPKKNILLYCCVIIIAIFIGLFTPNHTNIMLQIGCVFAAFVPALILSLRDHPMLIPYIVGCWVFSPALRRYLDWSVGEFQQFSLILILPHIVTFTLLFSILRNNKNRSMKQEFLSNRFYIFFLVSYIYATILGVALNKTSGIYDAIGYVAPALIFFYFFYKSFSQLEIENMIRVIVCYALIVSIYGWFQYLTLPSWDKFWLVNANMNSIGKPEPLGFRMFSTMNSQGPVAVFLSTVVVFMIMNKRWRGPVGSLGIALVITALFITLVRSAWITLIFGLVAYIAFMEKGKKIGKIISIVLIGICSYFLISKLPGAENITSRIETFQNIDEDHSFQERIELVLTATPQILGNPLGRGFGSIGRSTILGDGQSFAGLGSVDNGYLGVFSTFGVIGGLVFFIGLFSLFWHIKQLNNNMFRALALSSVVQLFVTFLFGGGLLGYQGVLFWLFVSIAITKIDFNKDRPAVATLLK
ncbi:O-antigen ligase family protein [Paenibacillus lautus]|uniref:O-antigen ligase family protein n=1 Tax=Paenibacillus lautus TaxID=1401 RepID=UPI003D2CBC9D